MEPQCTIGPELLTRIFELAYEDGTTSTGPLSRALLPFDRIERFKVIKVESMRHLAGLVELLDQEPDLSPLIKSIDFACTDTVPGPDTDDDPEAEPTPLPEHFNPPRFFSSVSRLASLIVSGPSAIFGLIVSSAFPALSPPRLNAVTLRIPSSWKPSCHPSHFQHLGSIRTIKSLGVHLGEIEGEEDIPFGDAASWLATPLPHLTHLAISFWAFADGVYAGLATACPALTHLTMVDTYSDSPKYTGLLPLLPITLVSLTLKAPVCFGGYCEPCDHFLPRFSNLQELYLGEGIFSDDSLFSNLRLLPALTRFTLGLGAIVDASDLLSFVSGSTRYPSLRVLVLDVLSNGRRGYRLVKDGNGLLHLDGTAETSRVAPDWTIPEFTGLSDGIFSVEAVEQLVLAGAQTGIKVEGSAIEGTGIYREWMGEATECLIAWGRLLEDYGELRAFLGGEAAEQLLRERRIKA
ncbi:hypothetical protein JCM10207_003201 [Rhodosporidiobolus poonsookiae]